MMTTIKDIKHENGNYWVLDTKDSYTVMKNGITQSSSVQSFKRNDDGLSCAIAYCDFLAKRKSVKAHEIDPDFYKNCNYYQMN